jgi:outer membrane protein assembly factor BamD
MLAARLAALALLIVALPACSWFGAKEDIVPDDPADKLYNEGLYLLNNKRDYKQAAKKFEEVDRQHPYSEWARKSLLMSAYAHYEGTEYDDSITAAKRYVTLHPGSPDAPTRNT